MTRPAAPSYLLDTNVLVHLIRDDATGRTIDGRFRLSTNLTRSVICVVTAGELLSLARQLGWGGRKRAAMRALLDDLIVADVNRPDVLDAYAELDYLSRRAGRTPGKNDLWIAAVARASGMTLLTTDKDFDHLAPSLISRVWIDPAKP